MRIYYNKKFLKTQLKYPIFLYIQQKIWILFMIKSVFLTSKVQTYDTDPHVHTPSSDLGTVLYRHGLRRGLSSF